MLKTQPQRPVHVVCSVLSYLTQEHKEKGMLGVLQTAELRVKTSVSDMISFITLNPNTLNHPRLVRVRNTGLFLNTYNNKKSELPLSFAKSWLALRSH